jgi:septal ring factor EnvC (AmiA/AmiB activator)
LKKIEGDIHQIEGEKKEFSKASNATDKGKMFSDKLAKVTKEVNQVEGKLNDYQRKRDKCELSIEQCKRDSDELLGKV